MKKYRILLISAYTMITLGACRPVQMPINIVNINDVQGIRKYTTFYTLPKTVIRVNVKLERKVFKKGPYYQYANSLLGLNDIIEEDGQTWTLTDIQFETFPVQDTTQMYLIESDENLNTIELNLTNEGLLASVNNENYLTVPAISERNIDFWQNGNTIGKFLHEDKEINFDDVPLPKDLYTKKSPGEEASFLASRILTLRDDRAAILVGDGYTENIPEGIALNKMISSIDSLQEKYLSMFHGRLKTDCFYYSFDFIPGEARKKTQFILFRFSEQFGIVENNDVSGMPMIIELESFENLKPYEQFNKKQGYLLKLAYKKGKETEKEKGLFYRIPEVVNARIIANDKILRQEQLQVAQFGSIHSLPVKYLDGNYTIEFYPDLGSIKSINRKENRNFEKKK